MAIPSAGRLALAGCLLVLVGLAPGFASAADTAKLTPAADSWVNAGRPDRNYGRAAVLRAQAGSYESYLRFKLTPWLGRPGSELRLVLSRVKGDASALSLNEVLGGWRERSVTYNSRPAQLGDAAIPGQATDGGVVFDLSGLFPGGSIDRETISLRVTSANASLVRFGARESKGKPRLEIGAATNSTAVIVAADAYATPVRPTANYGAVKWLAVDAEPESDTLMLFDLAAWQGRSLLKLELSVLLRDIGGKGVSVYRAGDTWDEASVTWHSRPSTDAVVAVLARRLPAGRVTIDVTAAFPGGVIDSPRLALGLTTTNADGFLLSSREGPEPPALLITSAAAVPPAPTPTPPATPSPSPSPSPTPSPTPTPTPTPMFYFRGQGGDHGVGMSQYGMRGRANDGQTYDQILAYYYSGTTLGTIDPATTIRVLLAPGYTPTPEVPARITARNGGWSSATFVDPLGARLSFAVDSYVQLVPTETGWQAEAYDAAGALVAIVPASDVLVEPLDAATRFEILWRSPLPRYTLYRGAMRLLTAGTTVAAINIVTMDDYVRGVVPAEVPALWPMEALKSQAVAARSYAFVRLRRDRSYDVVPTADNQVYGGLLLEHPRTEQAVSETALQVVMAGDQVANTFFFAVGGGHTENNEYVWVGTKGNVVGTPISYLRGMPDVDANGRAYDYNAPGFAWASDAFSWEQLQQTLNIDPRTNVGTLIELQFDRGVSGRVYRATIVGSARTVRVSASIFRSVFNANRPSGGSLQSAMFYLEPAPAV